MARSSGTRPRSAASGIMISLARSPGPRAAPITATSGTSAPSGSAPSACSRTTAPAAAALTTSAAQETRRGPTRSSIGPASALTSTYGAISANATIPVCTALPVLTYTNQGSAMADTRVPVSATVMAASTPAKDRALMPVPAGPG
ncbi:hypothetical protein GCM10020220_113490 [Nonomuraea rubra]